MSETYEFTPEESELLTLTAGYGGSVMGFTATVVRLLIERNPQLFERFGESVKLYLQTAPEYAQTYGLLIASICAVSGLARIASQEN